MQSTQSSLEVPIRHESEFGKVLDLQKEQVYLITRESTGQTLETIQYNTPLPEFVFDSYFSMADTTSYRVQTGDDMNTALDMGSSDTVTSLQLSIPDAPEPQGGFHKPVLDIDFPAALLPSSTTGHYHLYLDKEVPWDDYVELLTSLAKCGIIEQGYADVSIERGHTAVRLPWVKKPVPSNPSPEAGPEAPWLGDDDEWQVELDSTSEGRRAAKAKYNIQPAPEQHYPNPTY